VKEITYAILGYGGRGQAFAGIIKESPQLGLRATAVAEPDPDRRRMAAELLGLPSERIYSSAEDLLRQPRMADAVINTTMDQLHRDTAIAAMRKGYHLLLEKPMAVTLEDCRAIVKTQEETGAVSCVCHSLRYNLFYAEIKKELDSGAIGDVISFDQLEGVGDVHYTVSFVRGNWSNQGRSTFMLMSKSCHDIDLFSYLTGRKCRKVSSFGELTYFTAKNKPEGAPAYCMDGCPVEASCPYHSGRVFLEEPFWRIVFPRRDEQSVKEYLRDGRFGRCVFGGCDNDVVDHQVVSLLYEGGITGTFTMTAFHPGDRYIRIHGTKGYLEGRLGDRTIHISDFVTGARRQTTVAEPRSQSHAGGDYLVLQSLSEAIRMNDPRAVLTDLQETLESHRIVFAAERARLEKRVVDIDEML
jgi:predicted dehydrogenase